MDNSVETTIDLKVLLSALLKHIKFIILVTLIFAAGALFFTKFFMTEKYTATAQIYVDPRNDAATDTQISYNDLYAAEKLVNTCQILFTGDKMVEYVAEDLKGKYDIDKFSNSQLKSMISVEAAAEETSVMNIRVVTDDPELSKIIANIVVDRANEVYKAIVEGGTVKTVNTAVKPAGPSSPNTKRNVTLGFAAGLILSCGIIIVIEILDTKVKPTDELEQMYGIPLFAEIVDCESNIKGGY